MHEANAGFLAVSLHVSFINPVVGCRSYFPPGSWLLSQTKRSPPLSGTKLYCLVTEVHSCKQLAQGNFLFRLLTFYYSFI